MEKTSYRDVVLYRRLLRLALPYWPQIGALSLVNLLSTPLALLTPLPLKIAVDSIIGAQPLPAFFRALPAGLTGSKPALLGCLVGFLLLISACTSLQTFGSWMLQNYAGEKLLLDFRAQMFRHVQRLSLSYHDTKGTADSTYRIQSDATSIQTLAITGLMPFAASIITLAGMIYVTARIDWQLALVALAVSPLLVLLTRASLRGIRGRWREVKQLESSAMSVVQEVLSAVRVVKAFTREDHEEERFVKASNRRIQKQTRVIMMQSSFDLLAGLLVASGTAAVLFIGVLHVSRGVLSLGNLLLIMGYVAQLYDPLYTLSKKLTTIQSSLAGAERAFALLDETPEVEQRSHARPIARAAGAITFSHVTFAYKDYPVLHDISFAVPAGARVGIIGKTGAGKTTLVTLLTRFYDPKAGQILLDGVDLRDYKLYDLRNQFAIVQQEPVLFSTTIAENISYGRPGASQDEIEAAARAANAHDFISALPEGYDTPVGERGMQLSGGERQRVSLARAFLRDAPILLLDEPTSSVDIWTEAAIIEALERLMKGRTTFTIAHRLSTVEKCDPMLVLENGRLVFRGSVPEHVIEEIIADAKVEMSSGGNSG